MIDADSRDASADSRAARYLAQAGRVLERFDPQTSLQAILELAVPALADVGFIHFKTAAHPVLAAAAHRDAAENAALAPRIGAPEPVHGDTPIGRVLDGGAPELVVVDDAVLAHVSNDAEQLAALRARDYRCAVVAPLAGREGVLGAVTFLLAGTQRRYDDADLAMLGELARRTGIALDNHRLFLAERQARQHAEEARMRERQLHVLASRLSTALTTAQVAVIVSEGAIAAAGAYAALAALRAGDVLETVGSIGARDPALLARVATVPLTAPFPLADAVRRGALVWCADREQIIACYPQSLDLARTIQACGAVPFMFEGRTIGALAIACDEPFELTPERREMLQAIGQLAAHAFERARLYDALQKHKDELEHAVERARVADRRKDEFLAMLGHELRNPLAPIATALDLMDLKGTGGLFDKEREVIRRQVAHMSRLIDDLLDVSRITRGKIELTRRVLEVGPVIARAVEMASPLLEKKFQRLSIEVAREGLLVNADETRLAQIFQNLLTNAAKYSDPNTQITISARTVAGEVVVDVSDTGIGIAPELLPRLFDLFVQGERAIDRAAGGLGLGLTIARSLCELHGGSIAATSPGLGRGSTFTVRLPLASAESLPAAERTTVKMPKLSRGARVLVVDDNVDAAQMLHEFLSELGHEPAVAHDGVAALELLETFHPEVAVLDIGLPVMDGYELARRLRERLGAEKLRLIAMSGYGHDADRERANEAGFDHHLVKPVALDMLVALLDRLR